MAFVDATSFDENVLESMNSWTETVHAEIQDSGAVSYDSTRVRPLDREYRKKIGDYLSQTFNLDYTAVMFFLDGTEATYDVEDDLFLVCYDLLDPGFGSSERETLAHEQGHRLGNRIVEQRLKPLGDNHGVSPEAYRMLEKYLKSENFAERTKVAAGNTLGEDFDYRVELVEETPVLYSMNGRLGPEELVDPGREETLPEMISDVERMLNELSSGEPYWLAG